MTVASNLNRKEYAGNGVTTSFSTSPVVFFDTADLDVYAVVTATGAATLLTENTHYTVTGGAGAVGTVNTAGGSSPYGAPAAGITLAIVRNVDLLQQTDLINNDVNDAEVLEDALDLGTMMIQQTSAIANRSLRLPDSDVSGASVALPDVASRANRVVGFDANGAVTTHPVTLTVLGVQADKQTATAGQTVFNVNFSYLAGVNALSVYVNGLRQRVATDYTETSSTSVTFTYGLQAGDEVDFFAGEQDAGGTVPASGVSFMQSGSGAVSRTSQDKHRERKSLLDFVPTGFHAAILDGTTTQALDAYMALALAEGYRYLILPGGGTYVFESSVTLDSSDTVLQMWGATIKNNSNNTTTPTFNITVSPGTVDRVQLLGGVFTTDNACGDHVRVSRCSNFLGVGLRLLNGDQNGVAWNGDVYNATLINCEANGNALDGFSVVNAGGTANNANHMIGCRAINNRRGFYAEGDNQEFLWQGGYCEDNGTAAAGEQFYIRGGQGFKIRDTYAEAGVNANATWMYRVSSDAGGNNGKEHFFEGCRSAEVNTGNYAFLLDAANDCVIEHSRYNGNRGFVRIDAGSLRNTVGKHCKAPNAATYLLDNGTGTVDERENRMIRLYDDFTGDVLADQWDTKVGTDPQCVAFVKNAAVNPGGIIRGTTGDDAAASMAVNGIQIHSDLDWQADSSGGLACEFRLAMSANTDIAVFVGFTDQKAALEMPIHASGAGNGITTNATDAVGVLFDTAMTDDNWWLVGVANDVDATAEDSTLVPSAGAMETWRIEVSPAGAARFYRNGTLVGASMAGAVRATVPLTPVVAAFSRGAASRNIDVDLISAQMRR